MVSTGINNVLLKLLSITLLLLTTSTSYAADSNNIAGQEPSANVTHSISAERKAELHNLLLQDCGSCHGMTMKGGLGPALTADVLKTKSRAMIEVTILQGRPGTPMPPWKTILSKDEVRWIVDQLYAGTNL